MDDNAKQGGQEESPIIRKAILTVSARRNAENHPEYLDTENLLERFEPLIRSIHKRFCSYDGMFDKQEDIDDLYSQIQYEFLKLRQRYDPKVGVDFPGYIKFLLQQRVYHYVTSQQRIKNIEQPVRQYDDEDINAELDNYINKTVEEEDLESAREMRRVEGIASIPWDSIKDPYHIEVIKGVLLEQKSLEIVAADLNVSTKFINNKFEEVCSLLYSLNTIEERND